MTFFVIKTLVLRVDGIRKLSLTGDEVLGGVFHFMRAVLTILGAMFLVAATTVLSALLLPACGVLKTVAPTWVDWCPANTQAAVETRLAALTAETVDLERRIAARERELALMQCRRKPPPVVAEADEPVIETPPPIDQDAWEERDISSLEGCWELDSKFSTTNRQTGQSSQYSTWRMCFDGLGNGREEMLAENGGSCKGSVLGRFDAKGSLMIEEPGNLQCSDGGFIYRLSSRCELIGDGTANCVVTQPESGRSTTVNFRRAARTQ